MPLTHHRFTVDEYHRMAEAGILTEDDRVELLEGDIVEMSPIGRRHAGCVNRLNRLFVLAFGDSATISVRNPVLLSQTGEPQPDVTVLAYRADGYAARLPEPPDVLLLVGVADSSAAIDRKLKRRMYAAAGVPEYWIVDLSTDRIEVYQEPQGERFAERRVLGRESTLTPLRFSDVRLRADEILG